MKLISIDLHIYRWHYAATSGLHYSRWFYVIYSSAHRFIIEVI